MCITKFFVWKNDPSTFLDRNKSISSTFFKSSNNDIHLELFDNEIKFFKLLSTPKLRITPASEAYLDRLFFALLLYLQKTGWLNMSYSKLLLATFSITEYKEFELERSIHCIMLRSLLCLLTYLFLTWSLTKFLIDSYTCRP